MSVIEICNRLSGRKFTQRQIKSKLSEAIHAYLPWTGLYTSTNNLKIELNLQLEAKDFIVNTTPVKCAKLAELECFKIQTNPRDKLEKLLDSGHETSWFSTLKQRATYFAKVIAA